MTSLKPGWKMVKFGEVIKNANLVERDPEANGVERIVGLEHIDPENLHIRRWNSVADGTSFTRKFVPGQTLFGKRRAYQRKVAYAEFNGICSAHAMVVRAKPKMILPEFLPFFLQSDMFMERAIEISVGSLSPTINWKTLKVQEFPLPPLDEQKRIAEILWAADEVVEKYLQAKKQVQETMATTFQRLVVSSKHKKRRIGDLGTVIIGSTPSTKNPAFYDKREFMFVSPADIGADKYVSRTEKMVSSSGFESGREIPENAVMVVCIGSTTGKVAMSSERCITNQQINSVACNEHVDPDFVFRLLKQMEEYFYRQASCTALPILNKSQFSAIEVLVPSLEEQKKIVAVMRDFENAGICLDGHIDNTRSILDKVRQEWGAHV
jgi:type I restriction enzyme S subunit